MIDNKKIEENAKYYAEENSISIEDQMGDVYDGIEELSNAYKAGAHWAIEQLSNFWHHKSEIPDGKILYIDNHNFPYGITYNYISCINKRCIYSNIYSYNVHI